MEMNTLDLVVWVIGLLILLWVHRDKQEIEILIPIGQCLVFTFLWILVFVFIDFDVIDILKWFGVTFDDIKWVL
jgi:hypothetical protein